jgi:hypothetical protein
MGDLRLTDYTGMERCGPRRACAGPLRKKYEPDADETRRLFQKWLDDEKHGPNADDPILSQTQKWLDAETAPSA